MSTDQQSTPLPILQWKNVQTLKTAKRPAACTGCYAACRARFDDAVSNEANCIATSFYWDAKDLETQRRATELVNQYGVNAVEMCWAVPYLNFLHQFGMLKKEGIPECPLDFNDYGSLAFAEQFIKMVAYGDDGKGNENEFGKDLARGIIRAAKKWGRLKGALPR